MIRRKGKKLKEPKEENQKEPIFYLNKNSKKKKRKKKKRKKEKEEEEEEKFDSQVFL